MPYGTASPYRDGNRLTIEIDLPDRGEVSKSGRSENLVDPEECIVVPNGPEPIRITLTVVRPLRVTRTFDQERSSGCRMWPIFGSQIGNVGFDDSLDLFHIDKSSLNPMFFAAFGVKHDARFKGQGVLASFNDPEFRFIYAIAVDALNVVRPGSSDKPFSLMVPVDYETAMKQPASGYVP